MACAGDRHLEVPVDVAEAQALRSTCDLLLGRWGGIDMVIYCAGVYTPMRAWEIDLKLVRETLSINLQGVYNLLDAIVPVLIRQGSGGICLVSSSD